MRIFFFNVLTGAFLGNFPLTNSIVCQWAIQCVVEKLHHKTHCFFMASLQIYLDNVHFEWKKKGSGEQRPVYILLMACESIRMHIRAAKSQISLSLQGLIMSACMWGEGLSNTEQTSKGQVSHSANPSRPPRKVFREDSWDGWGGKEKKNRISLWPVDKPTIFLYSYERHILWLCFSLVTRYYYWGQITERES